MRYWLGLGANLGDRSATLRRAADALAGHGRVLARSHLYASDAVGGPEGQPPFLNAALVLDSQLGPRALLDEALAIERTLGRERARETRWGPRPVDIDLLLAGEAGELTLESPELELPHPRLHERAFALAGVVELAPDLVHPRLGVSLASLLAHALAAAPATVLPELL